MAAVKVHVGELKSVIKDLDKKIDQKSDRLLYLVLGLFC